MYDMIIDKIEYIPRKCLLELCFKCNLKCKHCGSSLNAYEDNRKGEQLTKEEMIKIVDDLKELGCEEIGLVGGEPLLCDFWEELAQYASSKGFYLKMISNGMLIDDNMAVRIKKAGVKLVALSLDGVKEFHNYLRGNRFAYDNVMRAAKALKAVGIQVNIITTVMKENIDLLPEVEKIVHSLKASFWQLQLGIPMGNLEKNAEMLLPKERLKDVAQFILDTRERGLVEITLADSIGYCSKDELLLRNNSSTTGERMFLGCMAGCKVLGIESNGNVKGCLSLQREEFIEGNVRERSIKDIWNDENSFKYNRKFSPDKLGGECAKCKYGLVCRGGCTTLAFNTTGQVNKNEYCLHLLEDSVN
ncbi:MAG: radical SAM protein [Clostridium sp.]|nr:radical SAM protein [Clostridium sp.]